MPRSALLVFSILAIVLGTSGCKSKSASTTPDTAAIGFRSAEEASLEADAASAGLASEGGQCGGEPLTVTFYDAGQALAALVSLPDGRRILVDTGESPKRPGCREEFCGTWNDRVIVGLTDDLQGDVIDMVWITHQHSDHHGGLPTFPASPAMVIKHYVDNGTREDKAGVKKARKAARDRGATLHEVDPEHLDMPIASTEEVQIEAVVPDAWPVSCGSDPNECSIGLKITYCDSSMLFTGDGEHKAEEHWPLSDINLLQVGHHGSNTSTTRDFIDVVKPEYAVISSGKRDEGTNKTYCHPIKGTVDRLTAATGGPGSRSVVVYDASTRKCSQQTEADWKDTQISDHLWLTAFDGEISLVTTGDGKFTRGGADLVNINTASKSELEGGHSDLGALSGVAHPE